MRAQVIKPVFRKLTMLGYPEQFTPLDMEIANPKEVPYKWFEEFKNPRRKTFNVGLIEYMNEETYPVIEFRKVTRKTFFGLFSHDTNVCAKVGEVRVTHLSLSSKRDVFVKESVAEILGED